VPRPLIGSLVLLSIALTARADDRKPVLDVWPGKPPGVTKASGPEKDVTTDKDGKPAGKRVIRLGNVSRPTLTVYAPPKDKANGTAVIVCPGGGYNILALDLEGTEVCEWLNSIGVTAVLLKYRVPAPGDARLGPLQDAQRAVSLVRSKAKDWGVDPKRIGILGFSAGGHLAARTAYGDGKRKYDAIDKVDEVSCQPDFTILVYPAYLTNKSKDALSDEIVVTKDSPPAFLAHAKNDPVTYKSSELLAAALKKAKVPAELRLYETGGHGYGLRKTKEPCTTWNERCAEWLAARKLLEK
jgi:acetyl esterase/lipase